VSPFEFVLILVGMGTVTSIVGLISRGVLRYQDRQLRAGEVPPDTRAELDELRSLLAEQQDLRQRVLDMEERLDFAERLLTQAKQEQLSPGRERRP
jgi:hypothetical protein